jgi:glutaminyl-peptide cyclotransferase
MLEYAFWQAIERRMRSLGWQVDISSHEEDTLIGHVSFHNVVATLDPAAPRRLVLACHYDSKMTPQGFVGATDSAVPCAQLIDLAYTLRRDLQDSMVSRLADY